MNTEITTLIENLENQEVGTYENWKFGLITREIYRKGKNKFQIDDTSHGWVSANVILDEMKQLIKGEKKLSEINWK
jgi:hypothetical protein